MSSAPPPPGPGDDDVDPVANTLERTQQIALPGPNAWTPGGPTQVSSVPSPAPPPAAGRHAAPPTADGAPVSRTSAPPSGPPRPAPGPQWNVPPPGGPPPRPPGYGSAPQAPWNASAGTGQRPAPPGPANWPGQPGPLGSAGTAQPGGQWSAQPGRPDQWGQAAVPPVGPPAGPRPDWVPPGAPPDYRRAGYAAQGPAPAGPQWGQPPQGQAPAGPLWGQPPQGQAPGPSPQGPTTNYSAAAGRQPWQSEQDAHGYCAYPANPEQFATPSQEPVETSRRSLIAGAGIAVVAGAAGFAWYAAAGPQPLATPPAGGYSPPSDGPTGSAAALATVADIPEGGGVVLAGQGVVLTRESGNTVRGFSSVCTHQGCSVSQVTGGEIICPCHGSKFSATTGAVINGPAAAPLAEVPVTVTNGSVYPG